MPNIGYFHPQIVHFVVALLFVGVGSAVVGVVGLAAVFKAAQRR